MIYEYQLFAVEKPLPEKMFKVLGDECFQLSGFCFDGKYYHYIFQRGIK